jgi:predicted XRE-type DNA-binding protein
MIKKKNDSISVYDDLGVADAGEMLIKAQLASTISEIIKRRKLTQAQTSTLLSISQSRLSDILQGRFRNLSGTSMLECLTRLGSDVQIVVKPVSRSRKIGHMSVLFA